MTARELIAALQKLSEAELDLNVSTEGCDCFGDVGTVEVGESYPTYKNQQRIVNLEVLLLRPKP